ncbi:MAG: efflux RND transporter periplasmic adaptor subunit [Lachnospiraceae bacterium]
MSGTYSRKKKIIKIVIGVVILAVIAVVAVSVIRKNNQRKEAQKAMTQKTMTSTTKVSRMDLSNSISVTGTIESVDSRTITSDLKDVKVTEVAVKVGEYVEEGQVICRLDSADLEKSLAETQNNYTVNQQLDALKGTPLDEYNDAVEKAQKTYNSTETNYHTKAAEYNEAFAVACGAFGIDSGAEDAKNLLSAAIDAMQQGDDNYNAKSEAVKSYQSAKTSFISAETSLINAKETYDEAVEKAKKTYEQDVLSEKLISQDSELSKIEDYQEQIESCTITAPTSGVIASIEVSEGDTISGGTIFTMLDNEHFKVTATVDEYDINSISLNQRAYVKTNATGDEEIPATVTYVAVISSSTQMSSSASYRIEITLDEAQTLLRTGMTASVSIELESTENALVVPYDCVTTGKNGKSTITVIENGEEKTIEVTKGLETDYYVEISGDGISEGTEVVLPVTLINTGSSKDDMGFGFTMPGGDMGGGMPSGGGQGGLGGGQGGPSGGQGGPGSRN